MPMPGGRRHWPEKSGYFDSSNARAPAAGNNSAAASVSAPIAFRLSIFGLPFNCKYCTGFDLSVAQILPLLHQCRELQECRVVERAKPINGVSNYRSTRPRRVSLAQLVLVRPSAAAPRPPTGLYGYSKMPEIRTRPV